MNWWHTIEMPNGELTAGKVNYIGAAGERFLLPSDLTGKSVLDFGTWDGFWAIESMRRGAAEVVATDRHNPILETAKLALGSFDIPYHYSGDLDYPIERPQWREAFDVVLFFGLLYHLKNPHMGLWNAAHCCKPGGNVIVETAVNQGKAIGIPKEIPAMWIIDSLHDGDASNYYVPNLSGAIQLCKLAGLEVKQTSEILHSRVALFCERKE